MIGDDVAELALKDRVAIRGIQQPRCKVNRPITARYLADLLEEDLTARGLLLVLEIQSQLIVGRELRLVPERGFIQEFGQLPVIFPPVHDWIAQGDQAGPRFHSETRRSPEDLKGDGF